MVLIAYILKFVFSKKLKARLHVNIKYTAYRVLKNNGHRNINTGTNLQSKTITD